MPRPRRTQPLAAMLGAGLGAVAGGPLGAGLGGLLGAALGSNALDLEEAIEQSAEEAGLTFSNLRWIDRRTLDVVFSDSSGLFHIERLTASSKTTDVEEIADELFDQFEQLVRSFQRKSA